MVTIGMNYKVIPGKEETFETAFNKVVKAMGGIDGHDEKVQSKSPSHRRRTKVAAGRTSIPSSVRLARGSRQTTIRLFTSG